MANESRNYGHIKSVPDRDRIVEIRKLNSLRGIAALIVLVSHYSNSTGILGNLLGQGAGQLGVMLFFMLSGFLISFLYLDKAPTSQNLKRYCVARFARVAPLFLLTVFASFLFTKAGITGFFYKISDARDLASHLLLLSGDSVLWTIPPELQFYGVFLLFWITYFKYGGYLYVLMAGAFVSLVFAGFPDLWTEFHGVRIQAKLLHTLPVFLIGVILGRGYKTWRIPENMKQPHFSLALLLILALYPQVFSTLFGRSHEMWGDMSVVATMSLSFFAITFLVPESSPILANRIGDFLGQISYSLYLLHLPVLELIKDPAQENPALFLFIFLASSIFTSWISFRYFERPMRGFLKKAFSS